MKLMGRLGLFFYMIITLVAGCVLVLFALNLIPFYEVVNMMHLVYNDPQARFLAAAIAGLVLFMNYIFARSISGLPQRGKQIAFDNPSGRVSVSVSALEDLIQRVISRVDEVKDVRSAITAGKKGLEVQARLILNTDVNIPEMTSRLQEVVKRKINDTIGLEEAVMVKVHVVKIIPDQKGRRQKEKKEKDDDDELPPSAPTIPFQGYRA